MSDVYDYYESGFRVFGIHHVNQSVCDCGDAECKALYKHPMTANWQTTPLWSVEQFEFMDMTGQFKTGFGVLCDGYLVVDVDPRNGGFESLEKLNNDLSIDLKKLSNFVVLTGGGGYHLYFKNNSEKLLKRKLKDYEGIDFMSSGFVIGASSLHASGMQYEREKGSLDEIDNAPIELLDLLEYEQITSSDVASVDEKKIKELLSFVPNNDLSYDDWIMVGMVIYGSLGQSGFDVWMDWSATSSKHLQTYTMKDLQVKYRSFANYSGNKVTVATLYSMAQQNGYIEPVTFDDEIIDITDEPLTLDSIPEVDLTVAEGLVGECAKYIDSCCLYPRREISMSSALAVVGALGGLDSVDDKYRAKSNCLFFNVAGSGTGKESVLQAQRELLTCGGLTGCTFGSIKSEQEIYRNIADQQINIYLMDEVGIFLGKVKNSKKSGASYLEGVLSAIMQIYSKSNGRLIVGGDTLKELMKVIRDELKRVKKLEPDFDNDDNRLSAIRDLEFILSELPKGLANPFLTLTGFTTPITFTQIFDRENATNGFIARSIIVEEKDDIPRRKENFCPPSCIPFDLEMKLKSLNSTGKIEITEMTRIRESKDKKKVITTDEANELLYEVYEYFHEWQVREYHESQLHAIVRRAYEMVIKVSMILAIGDGFVRKASHVAWAFNYIKRDIKTKLAMAKGTIAEEENDKKEEIMTKVMSVLDYNVPNSLRAIYKKYPKFKKEDFQEVLEQLARIGKVRIGEIRPARGKPTIVYYLNK